jgi:type II secretory pathway pseudopilin PulG
MEVLITLAVLGLAASVVLPSLSSGLGSAARHSARLSLEERVLQLRRTAMNEQRTYRLGDLPPGARPDEAVPAVVDLPAGWTFDASPAVMFFPDGTCSGGLVTLSSEDGRARGQYVIRPPVCRPRK